MWGTATEWQVGHEGGAGVWVRMRGGVGKLASAAGERTTSATTPHSPTPYPSRTTHHPHHCWRRSACPRSGSSAGSGRRTAAPAASLALSRFLPPRHLPHTIWCLRASAVSIKLQNGGFSCCTWHRIVAGWPAQQLRPTAAAAGRAAGTCRFPAFPTSALPLACAPLLQQTCGTLPHCAAAATSWGAQATAAPALAAALAPGDL